MQVSDEVLDWMNIVIAKKFPLTLLDVHVNSERVNVEGSFNNLKFELKANVEFESGKMIVEYPSVSMGPIRIDLSTILTKSVRRKFEDFNIFFREE